LLAEVKQTGHDPLFKNIGNHPISGINEDRHFKFGTYVRRGKYKPTKDKVPLQGTWSG